MATRDEILQNATDLIVKANPGLVLEIAQATEAELCGSSRTEYSDFRISQMLEKLAAQRGVHVWDYQLMLAEQSGMNVESIREEDRRASAAALGVDDLIEDASAGLISSGTRKR